MLKRVFLAGNISHSRGKFLFRAYTAKILITWYMLQWVRSRSVSVDLV